MLHVRSTAGAVRISPQEIPPTGRRIVPRPRLVTRLEAATRASRVVAVGAEAGSGKTSLVASWTGHAGPKTVVNWRTLSDHRSLVDVLDQLPGEESGLLPGGSRLREVKAADQGARILETEGAPCDRWVVVLDRFPTEPDGAVDAALERFLQRTGPHVGLVLIHSGSARIDVQRLGVAADSHAIDSEQLALNQAEIAAVLARHGVDPSPTLIDEVWRRTCGWAWGVRLAASRAAHSGSVEATLREIDRAIADYLENSILRDLTSSELDLLRATSMVEHVTGDLASEVSGGNPPTIATICRSRGFVRAHGDGSFTLHPLLRRHLLQRLRRDGAAARSATRRVAGLLADHHDLAGAVAVALDAADWAWAGRALVDELRVPRLLSWGADPLLAQADVLDGVGAAEPVLLAAAALGRSWPDLAARAIRTAVETPPRETVPARLSVSLVRMSLARWEADPETGLACYHEAIGLLPELSVTQRSSTPELMPLLQAHLASFELAIGAPDRARSALERGARTFRQKGGARLDPAAQAAAADCLGQLAWVQALGGELSDALHHAGEVETGPPALRGQAGSWYARLAGIWCHLSRGDVERAVELFDSFTARTVPPVEAWLPELAAATALTATRVANARLATCGDRISHGRSPAASCFAPPVAPWSPAGRRFDHQLRVIRAEAELDAGAPSAALALLAESSERSADVHVLRARAWIQLGDLASVAAALRVRRVETLTPQTQVQLELIEAWLARAHQNRAHERALIDRALAAAGRELLRAPIGWAKPWLHDVITSDSGLLRRHGQFLASVRGSHPEPAAAPVTKPFSAPVSPLTGRELDILQRLGALSTNEEIAAELYLSPNTIKTHLKSLYRKLDVTRRSDAFRRGRSLGLC